MSESQSSGEIKKEILNQDSSQDFHLEDIIGDDQFLAKNPHIKSLLLEIRKPYQVYDSLEAILAEDYSKQFQQIKVLEQKERQILKNRETLFQSLQQLSNEKRIKLEELNLKKKLIEDKKKVQNAAVQQFKSSQIFKFLAHEIDLKPLRQLEQSSDLNEQQKILAELINLVELQLQNKIEKQQKRENELKKQIEVFLNQEKVSKQKVESRILVTYEEDINSKQAYLKKLQEKNAKLQKQRSK